MNSSTDANHQDRLGYLNTLQDVLRHPALFVFRDGGPVTPEAESAALLLAQTLGYCRLFGIEPPPDLDGSLPVNVALAATRRMLGVLDRAMEESDVFPERWEAARSQLEMELLCSDLLHTRMNAWSVLLAVDEAALGASQAADPGTEALDVEVDRLITAIHRFDVALRRDEELLSTVCETRLLDNWRSLLGEEYAGALPWWLDGTLERAAAEIGDRNTTAWPNPFPPAQETNLLQPASASHPVAILQSVRSESALAAEGQAIRPHRGKLEWSSEPDGRGYMAMLSIPSLRKVEGQTTISLMFRAQQDTDRSSLLADLPGKLVCLGGGRSIVRSRDLQGFPGFSVPEATFLFEHVEQVPDRLDLRVDGRLWFPVLHQENDL